MADVLLVTPHSDRLTAERSFMCPPPGLLRLASYLRACGHYAEYYDANLYEITGKGVSLAEKLQERAWSVVGISCLENSLPTDIANMYLVEKLCPNATLVAGGMEAQFNYQTILDKSPCRIVVLGEGEIPLKMIVEGVPLHEIPGIVFKNKSIPLTKEQFDEITDAIAWESIDYESYWDYYVEKFADNWNDERDQEVHTVRVFSRNRCPIGCKFCTSTNQLTWGAGRPVPVIGADNDLLVDVIGRIIKSHPRVRTVYLTDDDFCINPVNAIRFCKKIVERGFNNLSFMCFSRITDLNDELLSWMKKAGFRRLNIGVESFSQRILTDLGKRCDASVIDSNLMLCKKHGVQPYMNVLMITPTSQLEDIELTVDKTFEYTKDTFFRAGAHLAIAPLYGSELRDSHCHFKSYLRPVSGTNLFVKRDEMILADDIMARQAQILFYENSDDEMKYWQSRNGLVHFGPQNIAAIKLNLMKKCIDRVRREHGLPEKQWASGATIMEGMIPDQPLKLAYDERREHGMSF